MTNEDRYRKCCPKNLMVDIKTGIAKGLLELEGLC